MNLLKKIFKKTTKSTESIDPQNVELPKLHKKFFLGLWNTNLLKANQKHSPFFHPNFCLRQKILIQCEKFY